MYTFKITQFEPLTIELPDVNPDKHLEGEIHIILPDMFNGETQEEQNLDFNFIVSALKEDEEPYTILKVLKYIIEAKSHLRNLVDAYQEEN